MVGAVAERLYATQCVAGSIPVRNKYFYDLQVMVPDLGATIQEELPRVGQCSKKNIVRF